MMNKLRLIPMLALAVGLTGCASAAERQARNAKIDHEKCASYGAAAGTQIYAQCRMSLEQNRSQITAAAVGGGGPTYCNRATGWCY